MKRYACFFRFCLFCAVLFAPAAYAAGLDCAQPVTQTEKAICASSVLRQQDTRLSQLYARLWDAQPAQRAVLQQAQSAWLQSRDQCVRKATCINEQYSAQVGVLQKQLHDFEAYKPDTTDRLALKDLEQAVGAQRTIDTEFPLERVLQGLTLSKTITTFSNVPSPDDRAHFPTRRPLGVTKSEWRALLASKIDGGGENGTASYTLLDVDGDGQRDLIIDSYIGGTGLYTYTSVLRRKGGKFTGAYMSLDHLGEDDSVQDGTPVAKEPSYLYSINGQGSNQEVTWIRLRGRVYAAYRNGAYGRDDLYLLRPLTNVGKVPTLTVLYRYVFSLPQTQQKLDETKATTLNKTLHTALTKALRDVSTTVAEKPETRKKPICPISAHVKDSDREAYYHFGTGHYSFEVVGDMPVWIKRQCYIGRVIDWFGGYSRKNGLYAQLWIRKAGSLEVSGNEQTFDLTAQRTVIQVNSSISEVVGDKGI